MFHLEKVISIVTLVKVSIYFTSHLASGLINTFSCLLTRMASIYSGGAQTVYSTEHLQNVGGAMIVIVSGGTANDTIRRQYADYQGLKV